MSGWRRVPKMRCFIAIDARSEKLEPLLNRLSSLPGVKAVEPENLHITLKFLGEISRDKAQQVTLAMERALHNMEPFSYSIRGVGAFPSLNYIRVIYAGVDAGEDRILEMQRRIEAELEKIGFKMEKRAFVPHITLARVKIPRKKAQLQRFIQEFKGGSFGEIEVDSVSLMESILKPSGPEYRPVFTLQLQHTSSAQK